MIGAGRRDKLTLIVFVLCLAVVVVGSSALAIKYLGGF